MANNKRWSRRNGSGATTPENPHFRQVIAPLNIRALVMEEHRPKGNPSVAVPVTKLGLLPG
jgi:hypothetical protein